MICPFNYLILYKMIRLFWPILILFSVFGLVIGVVLVVKPGLAIEIQKKFYAKINWIMEPISLSKEIRNTKIMGIFLIVTLILVLIYSLKEIG